jgi:hypothetical protein
MQKWWMTLVGGVTIAGNVGCPLVLGCVGMAGADIFVLQRFELLLRTKFIGLEGVSMS